MGEEVRPVEVGREEVLAGGGVNQVVRAGDTVRRPSGRWTPAVHALLRHLETAGFAGAPRCHGLDAAGREVLGFVPGEVPGHPVPAYVRSDAALTAAAALLRAYHDATAGFAAPGDAAWYFPPRRPAQVVAHGDVAPYNTVFRDGLPVAFIDFDTAHPAPRVWDVAYAAYRFVPLEDPARGAGRPVVEQARGLRLFADAYGLGAADRRALPGTVIERLEHLVGHMRARAGAGEEAFAAHLARGDHLLYGADADHLARHRATFERALLVPSGA